MLFNFAILNLEDILRQRVEWNKEIRKKQSPYTALSALVHRKAFCLGNKSTDCVKIRFRIPVNIHIMYIIHIYIKPVWTN